MTEVAVSRKIVSKAQVWEALLDGAKNGLTADQVAANLSMQRSTFNQALNKLRAQFVEAGKGEVFPQLQRKSKTGSTVNINDMITQAEAIKQS